MADGYACRFCWHALKDHNNDVGCPYCTCVSNRHEGMPINDMDDTRTPIRPEQMRAGTHRPRKEEPMTSATLDRLRLDLVDAERKAASAKAALEKAKREQEAIKALAAIEPPEPEFDRVIRFRVQFAPGATVYTYIAWHADRDAGGGWYVTNTEKHYSWKSLVELMRKDVSTEARGGRVKYYIYSTGDADQKSGWVNP